LGLVRHPSNSPTHARALNGAGVLAAQQGDLSAAKTLYAQGIDIWRDLGDQTEVGFVLNNLGMLAARRGELVNAQALLDEALETAQTTGDVVQRAIVQNNRGYLFHRKGELHTASACYAESAAAYRELADK